MKKIPENRTWKMKISVVSPVYKAAKIIAELVKQVSNELEKITNEKYKSFLFFIFGESRKVRWFPRPPDG